MHPIRRHVPPSSFSFSTHATSIPSCAARIAAMYPPGPAPITTRSWLFDAFSALISSLQEHPSRRLDALLDPLRERRRLAPVHDEVVVRHRPVHHRTDHHLPVARHGPVLDRVQSEDPALRRIHD